MTRTNVAHIDWATLVKRTIARFARGNIAAQQARILLPSEQARERERVRAITRAWKERAARLDA